jgi:hypothetical protein
MMQCVFLHGTLLRLEFRLGSAMFTPGMGTDLFSSTGYHGELFGDDCRRFLVRSGGKGFCAAILKASSHYAELEFDGVKSLDFRP